MQKMISGAKELLGDSKLPLYGLIVCLPFSQTHWLALPFLPGVFSAVNLLLLWAGWSLVRQAGGSKQEAVDRTQEAVGSKQEAGGSKQDAVTLTANCPVPTAVIGDRLPLKVPMLCFVVLGFVSILSGMGYGAEYLGKASLSFYLNWITPFLAFVLVLRIAKTGEDIKKMCAILASVAVLISLYAVVDYARRPDRVEVVFEDPNILGAFVAYTSCIVLGFLLLNLRDRKSWMLGIPFLIMVRALMCTFSRGAYLALAIALHVVVFFRSRLLFLLLLGVSVFLYLNPAFLPVGVRHRLGETYERRYEANQPDKAHEILDPSLQYRIEIDKAAVQMVREHPVAGVGYDRFPAKLVNYWSQASTIDAHNTYLLIAAEMGLPALAVFLWLLARIFWETVTLYLKTGDRLAKGLALGFLGSIPAFMLSNGYETKIFHPNVSSYFWILAALVMAAKQQIRIKN